MYRKQLLRERYLGELFGIDPQDDGGGGNNGIGNLKSTAVASTDPDAVDGASPLPLDSISSSSTPASGLVGAGPVRGNEGDFASRINRGSDDGDGGGFAERRDLHSQERSPLKPSRGYYYYSFSGITTWHSSSYYGGYYYYYYR